VDGRAIGNARLIAFCSRRSSRIGAASGDHDGGAGAAEFGQITVCDYGDPQAGPLPMHEDGYFHDFSGKMRYILLNRTQDTASSRNEGSFKPNAVI
jgi:hypothetical protein